MFEAIITVDGVIQQLRPTKLLGYGLDEEAYNTIKKWKFKAAKKTDGTPVAVRVPIEVMFKSY
jgi:outer membrane biosynthesis protein TonB